MMSLLNKNQNLQATIKDGPRYLFVCVCSILIIVAPVALAESPLDVPKNEQLQNDDSEGIPEAVEEIVENPSEKKVEYFQVEEFDIIELGSLGNRCEPTRPPNFHCCLDEWQEGSVCPSGSRLTSVCDGSCNNCGSFSCIPVEDCPTCVH